MLMMMIIIKPLGIDDGALEVWHWALALEAAQWSMPSAPCTMPHAHFPTPIPNAPCQMLTAECPIPNAQCPMLTAQCQCPVHDVDGDDVDVESTDVRTYLHTDSTDIRIQDNVYIRTCIHT